ncbi:MAG: hypothetical protein JW808_04195 [Victivallales bacterium]|nr:hypothetical protein [Victivallales bacterium]
MRKFIECGNTGRLNAALFVSGSGTNAERVLEHELRDSRETCSWNPALIVTDAPEKSRAREISERYGLPLVEHDIKRFYQDRGESRVSLAGERGRGIREEWTEELRHRLEPYRIDFGVLAGFVPLTNITGDFPCLNVHPGDLTVESDGKRELVGLHTLPVERAILAGHRVMRSSVIVAQPYTGSGGGMDTGPILGVSGEVDIELNGHNLGELIELASSRPGARPPGGYKDLLEELARHNQKRLKENGDWVVLPPVVRDFAMGRFALSQDGGLLYEAGGEWKAVQTVEYYPDGRKRPRSISIRI